MFIFIIIYRATGNQYFRRDEIQILLQNLEKYLLLNSICLFKIIISEQNNDDPFNRGFLYNSAFLETEKIVKTNRTYIMLNCDYIFNMDIPFPKSFLLSKKGFVDIYSVSDFHPILGGCCSFDPESFILCNGFPNNIYGWGGEDWAILRRIRENNVPYDVSIRNTGIVNDNSGWATKNEKTTINNDQKLNQINISKAMDNPINNNGLDNCYYVIDSYGEFNNDDKNIVHFLFSFDYK
jgi:hypothetical protein